jgi:DNA (cytosine-5)-methyltransferase 1
MNYYNENDKFATGWLRALIDAGLIPNGDVDERSIADVQPQDLKGYTQCHFFAGIGGWPYALKLAQWPSTRPVWTGSCPCQPLSVAGLGQGAEDEKGRHLWPEFARLICECEPPVIFGEQVASALGRQWLTGVRLDLEEMGYAVGAADLCAAGVSAPHIRQRLFWVAQSGLHGYRWRREKRMARREQGYRVHNRKTFRTR